jgi:tetratricopeptide (TPR) repeat protein
MVNVLIHIFTSIFLFFFLRITLDLPSIKETYTRHAYAIALLATILWSINPVHTQAITYIVQRMASMAGLFYMMSMLFYVKGRISKARYKGIAFYALTSLAFVLALGSKENAVMLPLSLFFYEILLLQGKGWKLPRRRLWHIFMIAVAVFIVGFGYLYLQGGNIFSFLDGYENRPFTLWQRLLTEGRVLVFYITLLLYPVPNRLNLAHDFDLSLSLVDPLTTLFAFLFIAALIIFAFLKVKRFPLVAFSVLFFFLNHLIESSVLPLELVFEHRNYIPSFFFFVPFTIGFFRLMDHYASKKKMRYVLAVFMVLLLVGYGHSCFIRNEAWKNEGTLWHDALDKVKTLPRIYTNLGRHYQNIGDSSRAALNYLKSLEYPARIQEQEHYVANYNLGAIVGERGNTDKAIDYYFRSLMLNPDFAAPYNNLAIIMDKRGNHRLAQRFLEIGYRLDPNSLEVNYNLGTFHVKTGNPDKAIFHLERIAYGRKARDSVFYYLGIAYKQKGLLGRAASFFEEALAENPRNLMPCLFLIEVFQELGDAEKAAKNADLLVQKMIRSKELTNQVVQGLTKGVQDNEDRPSPARIIPLLVQAMNENLKDMEELKRRLTERKSSRARNEKSLQTTRHSLKPEVKPF